MSFVCGRPLKIWIVGCTRSVCFRDDGGVDVLVREEFSGLFEGVQQQHCKGVKAEASSMVVRQPHVPSGLHPSAGSSDEWDVDVVISFTSSFLTSSFAVAERLLSSTVPCSIGLLGVVVLFGAVRVDSSDLCSSVKDSSQVT